MNVIDCYGDIVLCLPDCGKCKITGENPGYMDECPTDEYDGDCCPEMCIHYTED